MKSFEVSFAVNLKKEKKERKLAFKLESCASRFITDPKILFHVNPQPDVKTKKNVFFFNPKQDPNPTFFFLFGPDQGTTYVNMHPK